MPSDETDKAHLFEKTHSSQSLYKGRVINLRLDEVILPSGAIHTREVADHPGGAVVAPILPDGRLLFIEQFRYPLGHTLLEFPAGKLEPGEDPADTIRRELLEETGYEASHWDFLGAIHTAPGFCNEKLWLYRASGLTLANHHPKIEDENIDLLPLTLEEAMAKIRTRKLTDSKTMCLLALHQWM